MNQAVNLNRIQAVRLTYQWWGVCEGVCPKGIFCKQTTRVAQANHAAHFQRIWACEELPINILCSRLAVTRNGGLNTPWEYEIPSIVIKTISQWTLI